MDTYKTRSRVRSSTNTAGWKKLLWLDQPYEDNYTDSSFLSQLKRNSTVVKYSYKTLIEDFSIIVLHLSIIMLTIVVFYGIYILKWNPIKPTIWSTLITIIGFLIYVVTLKIKRNRELIELQQFKLRQVYTKDLGVNVNVGSIANSNSTSLLDLENESRCSDFELVNLEDYLTEPASPNIFETCKSSLLIILYLLTLSPVLKSLTNSTSSDSIWALSTWLSILNVMFNDYQIDFKKISIRDKRLHWGKLMQYNSLTSPLISPITTRSSSPMMREPSGLEQQHLRIEQMNNSQSNSISNFNFQIENFQNSNFSKNIAISNAIVLASRLQSNAAAFSFILFSIQTSGLFPIFNNFTRRAELYGFHQFQLISIVLIVDALIWHIFGIVWLSLWILLHFMIIFIGPWYFLNLQKYKNELQGPWDPAKPIVKSI